MLFRHPQHNDIIRIRFLIMPNFRVICTFITNNQSVFVIIFLNGNLISIYFSGLDIAN